MRVFMASFAYREDGCEQPQIFPDNELNEQVKILACSRAMRVYAVSDTIRGNFESIGIAVGFDDKNRRITFSGSLNA